ncbi:protein AF-17-like [Gigantopelta aegis]|uniref:protein AF-17-like n=1 Tax=Gigantopelta aegis TaxID=1735272 RepID=UPI001B8874C4|nr:protein AF-17-like [Gigantopelta aegis]
MKAMVGGCCVCSDERGWAENPLVYCDGHGCNVAVHQACYGIVQVPNGPWYCRKCESQERQARVKCELCPQKDGALKRTDTGGWCHVVCALFIPEAWFSNVQTMEPIVLKNVPGDRFNKICYICEEHGRETRATSGSCMTCNKNGCKQNFHVTCAQSQGLLCEEAGNYGDNVKYCGYCVYHYKKLNVRMKNSDVMDPAFCGRNNLGSCGSQPDKPRPQMTSPQSTLNTTANSDSSLKSPDFVGFTEADIKNHVTNGSMMEIKFDPGLMTTSVSVVSTTATSSTLSSMSIADQKLIYDARFKVSEASSGMFSSFEKSASPQTSASERSSPAHEETAVFPASFDKFVTNGPTTSMEDAATSTNKTSDQELYGPKRQRSRSQETVEKKKAKRGKQMQASVGKMKSSKEGSGKTVLTLGAKKHSQKRKNGTSGNSVQPPGLSSTSVFGGSPYFQSLTAPGPVSLSTQGSTMTASSRLVTCAGDASSTADSLDMVNGITGFVSPPKIFPSQQKSPDPSGFPQSMEQLLERQWEQGSQFLMEQGQHFDIASLLNCLNQLKCENQKLEEYVKNLTDRRDHLLTVNARLSLPFSNMNTISASLPDSTEHKDSGCPSLSPANPDSVASSAESESPSVDTNSKMLTDGPLHTVSDTASLIRDPQSQVLYSSVPSSNSPSSLSSLSSNPPFTSQTHTSSVSAIRDLQTKDKT